MIKFSALLLLIFNFHACIAVVSISRSGNKIQDIKQQLHSSHAHAAHKRLRCTSHFIIIQYLFRRTFLK